MSTPLQNRLVGTIIVAAVAIIFLPDIFDGEKQRYQDDFDNIPKAPKFESTRPLNQFPQNELDKVKVNTELSDEVAVDESPEPVEHTIEHDMSAVKLEKSPAPSKIKITAYKKPEPTNTSTTLAPKTKELPAHAISNEAWVVQLGSFRHEKNVAELITKLKSNGYTAFTAPIETKSGVLTKVFVGPELIKKSLEKKLPALKQLTNVDGKIERF